MKPETLRYDPVVTIGQVPFLAGAIVASNQDRALEQLSRRHWWQRALARLLPATRRNSVIAPPVYLELSYQRAS